MEVSRAKYNLSLIKKTRNTLVVQLQRLQGYKVGIESYLQQMEIEENQMSRELIEIEATLKVIERSLQDVNSDE